MVRATFQQGVVKHWQHGSMLLVGEIIFSGKLREPPPYLTPPLKSKDWWVKAG
jgi:hypothetical protein